MWGKFYPPHAVFYPPPHAFFYPPPHVVFYPPHVWFLPLAPTPTLLTPC